MKFGADNLPDDPVLLKALILQLQEENALLRHKLFSPKSERSPEDADSPQLAMFNEVEELIEAPAAEPAEAEAEVVAPVKRRGKRKPLPANLPRVEVIHEMPEHERTCVCGACKQVIGEETSEQLEIIPMQVRVIRHIRKTYACKACETAPVTADKPAQLIEKSLASSTLGLLVLVQLVMAAISTSPLPTVGSVPLAGSVAALASSCAVASAGLLDSISATKRGAPMGVGLPSGVAPTTTSSRRWM